MNGCGVVGQIHVPTLILTAQDDPLVPITSFRSAALLGNPFIRQVAPEQGGYCAFISNDSGDERFGGVASGRVLCSPHAASREGGPYVSSKSLDANKLWIRLERGVLTTCSSLNKIGTR